jgi:hypothetical protein
MTKDSRGGPGRGQGRKPIKKGQDTVTVSLRLTVGQRDKLALLGGAAWVRQRIDRATTGNTTTAITSCQPSDIAVAF